MTQPRELPSDVMTVFSAVFERVPIAEEELDAGPEGTEFMSLQCPVVLQNKSKELYRKHVRELIDRRGIGIEAATVAECAAGMSEMSLQTQLNSAGNWIYWKFFNELYPGCTPEPSVSDHDKAELAPDIEYQLRRRLGKAR